MECRRGRVEGSVTLASYPCQEGRAAASVWRSFFRLFRPVNAPPEYVQALHQRSGYSSTLQGYYTRFSTACLLCACHPYLLWALKSFKAYPLHCCVMMLLDRFQVASRNLANTDMMPSVSSEMLGCMRWQHSDAGAAQRASGQHCWRVMSLVGRELRKDTLCCL